MKVFLDDCRETPEGWVRCYWPEEVIELLKTGQVTDLSLDHDLGDKPAADAEERRERTGLDVLDWILEQIFHETGVIVVPPNMTIHSDNAVGIQNMRRTIASIWRRHADNMDPGPHPW